MPDDSQSAGLLISDVSSVDNIIVNNSGFLVVADTGRSQVAADINKGALILDSTRLYYSNGTDWASYQDQANVLDVISTVTPAADKFVYFTGASTAASGTVTSFMRTLLDDTSAATARTTLGVDPIGTDNSTNVTLAGSRDYLTLAGQVITRNEIDINDDTNLVDGTNLTFSSNTLNVDDAFLVNDADDTTTGTLTAANYKVANNGYIGSATTTDAIQIASNGAVTVKKAIKEAINPVTAVGSTFTLDMDVANFHTVLLTANTSRTIAVSNVALGQRFLLRLKQPYYGNGTVNWGFSTINWCDDTPPTIGSLYNHVTLIGFVKVGTNEYDGILIAADIH